MLLTALKIKSLKEVGKYSDGGGLYLVIKKAGSKSWVFRYTIHGMQREMGLGSADVISLSDARDVAFEGRKLIQMGFDPIDRRESKRVDYIKATSSNRTFKDCALEYIDLHKNAWRGKNQERVWRNSLINHVYPVFGTANIKEVSRDMVLAAIRPLWSDHNETANKIRNRIERILGYAAALGLRPSENPARWRDNLDHILPAPSRVKIVEHMPSIPRDEIQAFYSAIDGSASTGAALRFLILTATRNSETSRAEWSEFNFEERIWIIPAERMKSKREHVVPLSDQAIEILNVMKETVQSKYVFAGRIGGRPISGMSLLMIMRRLCKKEVPHGFRSTFKNWASEVYGSDDDVSESALAHAVKDKTKASYLRGNFLDKRRSLMQSWADFVSKRSSFVDLKSTQSQPISSSP